MSSDLYNECKLVTSKITICTTNKVHGSDSLQPIKVILITCVTGELMNIMWFKATYIHYM